MKTTAPSEFVLDDQICFALYEASRAMSGAYRDGLARLGLTYTQYVVLLLLWEHGTLSMGELGQRLRLDSATLSPLLTRLSGRALVTRRRSVQDERIVEVTCTAAGQDLRERVHAVQSDVESATGLTGTELAVMRGDLHRLAERLHDHSSARSTARGTARPDAARQRGTRICTGGDGV